MQKFSGGKWKYDHFPEMKSRAHQDSVMIFWRIGWTSFSLFPWTVFPGYGGGRNGKRHGYDLHRDGCQDKLGSHFFLSLLKGLLRRRSRYTFTTSKDHSHFYHTHLRVVEPGKRGRTKLKQPFKIIKLGVVHFQWVEGLRCYRALVWSQLLCLLLSLSLSPLSFPRLFLLLSHFLFPLLWL